MSLLRATLRHTWLWSHRLGVALLLALALAVSAARLWLPHIDAYRGDLEAGLSQALGVRVGVDALAADWRTWGPAVRVTGLRLYGPDAGAAIATFSDAEIGFDALASLFARQPVVTRLVLRGVHLHLDRGPDGRIRLLPSRGGEPLPLAAFAGWLGHLQELDISDGRMTLAEPTAPGGQLDFDGLRLSLRRDGERARIAFEAARVPSGAAGLRAVIGIDSRGARYADWAGTLYLHATDIELAALPLPPTARPQGGRGDVELWGDWRGLAFERLLGRVSARDLVPPAGVLPAALDARVVPWLAAGLALDFDWGRDAERWSAAGVATLHGAQGVVRDTFRGELAFDGHDYTVALHEPPLPALLAAAQAEPALAAPLARFAPGGRIDELALRFDPERPQGFALAARLDALGWQPADGVPGLQRLSGELRANGGGGELVFDSPGLRFDAPAVFRAPLDFTHARGRVRWAAQGDDGWLVSLDEVSVDNPTLSARVGGTLALVPGVTPYADLHAEVERVAVAATRLYLPTAVIPPDGIAWLDRALIGGEGRGGRALLRGPLAAFPFRDGSGEFDARLQVQDGLLDFAPGWPRLEGLAADVHFHNQGLDIETAAARLWEVPVGRLHTRIADLEDTVVEVAGSLRADGAPLTRLLRESPLAERMGGLADTVELRGPHRLDLTLEIPTDERPASGRGTLHFEDAALAIADWDVALTGLRGALAFSEAGLRGEDIALALEGEPMRLDVGPVTVRGRTETQFRIRGRFGPGTLLGRANAEALLGSGRGALVQGAAEGTLVCAVPADAGGPNAYSLLFESTLEGVNVRLPAPLAKAAGEKRAAQLRIDVGRNGRSRLAASYGTDVRALLELLDFPRRPRIERGDLRFGAGEAQLPSTPGIRITADVPRFEFDAGGGGELPEYPAWLSRVEAHVGELELAGHTFSDVRVVATGARDGLKLALDSAALRGELTLPRLPAAERPVQVRLQRLNLHAPAEEAEEAAEPAPAAPAATDPRSLPPLRVAVDDLRLDGRVLGRFDLASAPLPDGLALTQLELHAAGHDFSGRAEWRRTAQGPRSTLTLKGSSAAIGKTLEAFGYVAGIERGATEFDAELRWAADLPDISLAGAEGALRFTTAEGQLLEVDPGMGRFLGLFSLGAVARRLTLDFRDFFGQGFAFDRIEGRVRFADGLAHTERLTLEGPAARIELSGEVDLRRREYDQVVTVTPRVGVALPIAGAIAAGPVGAAAGAVLERLLRPGIDRLARYRYEVHGPWQSPEIERTEDTTPAEPTPEPSESRRGG